MAYYRIEPWGAERDALHAAIVARAAMQSWSKRPLRIESFLPKFGPQPGDDRAMADKLRGLAIRMRGKIIERRK